MPELEIIRKVKARRVFLDVGANPQPQPVVDWAAAALPPGFDDVVKPKRAAPKEDLPKIDLYGTTLRGEATPAYFILYDSEEEYNLRLRGTFISYKGSPVYIQQIYGSKLKFRIDVETGNGEILNLTEDNLPDIDTRSFAPGYLDCRSLLGYSGVGYLYRKPARIYRQGMNNENAILQMETDANFWGIGEFNRRGFMRSFESRKVKTPLTEKVLKDLADDDAKYHNPCQMLSTNFAAVKDRNFGEILLKFRGMRIGHVKKNDTVITNSRIAKLFGAEMKELNLV